MTQAALVNQASPTYPGRTLVVPNDAANSFLMIKLDNTQAPEEGGRMPPNKSLSSDELNAVRSWINQGASDDCANPDTGIVLENYHPPGWGEASAHGPPTKTQQEDCTLCHGADLSGGSSTISCDTCHPAEWRTTCTFCHGGEDNTTGAPPRDIDNSNTNLSFSPHTAHVSTRIHEAYDCIQCHLKPTDILSTGHLFVGDTTPGVSEVRTDGGLSPSEVWDGNGGCSNSYCHGDGQASNGSVTVATGSPNCDACHSDTSGGRDAWKEMSGEHEDHLRGGLACSDCHADTVSNGQTISDPTRHVNGTVDLSWEGGLTYNGTECNGACHLQDHTSREWD